jgi:tetratricopeptide (TPR) repeat protein
VIRGSASINEDVAKTAELIVSLANDADAYGTTSAYPITVLHIAKLWSQKQRDVHVLEWLKKLDPNRLGTDPGKGTDERGRDRELASRRERYYSLLTHALERLGRWQECSDQSSKAISDCGTLHHDNDIWFARRIALAKQKLGRPKEAVKELQRLAERKQASFLHSDIASAAWDAGDDQMAFKHALHALVAPQDIGYKLDAVRLIAGVLWQRGEKDHARRHIQLCMAVRTAKGWSDSTDLSTLAENWNITTSSEAADIIQRELDLLWRKWLDDLVPKKIGTVTKILPSGHAGFIQSNEHQDFYFDAHDWKGRRSAMAEGIHVSFATQQGFDRKRQRSTTIACDIRVVPG